MSRLFYPTLPPCHKFVKERKFCVWTVTNSSTPTTPKRDVIYEQPLEEKISIKIKSIYFPLLIIKCREFELKFNTVIKKAVAAKNIIKLIEIIELNSI